MKHTIILDGKEYRLNADEAIKQGILIENKKFTEKDLVAGLKVTRYGDVSDVSYLLKLSLGGGLYRYALAGVMDNPYWGYSDYVTNDGYGYTATQMLDYLNSGNYEKV